MKKQRLLFLFFLFFSGIAFAQNPELIVLKIPDSLKENANAVVRNAEITLEIKAINKYLITEKKTVTVFNEIGYQKLDISEYYDKSTSVKEIGVVVFDAFGGELKKIKRKDFADTSITEGSVITDGRLLYLNYTPTQYPITLQFTSVVESSNTAFLPKWIPMSTYYCSIESASFRIINTSGIKLRSKERNFNKNVAVTKRDNGLFYTLENYKALKKEDLSPSLLKMVPSVLFALEDFELEGVKGQAKDWNTFGKWVFYSFLKDSEELTEEEKSAVNALVLGVKSDYERAKLIYEYVQKKTRYVSIQLGVGGWKPMKAKDVSRLGYGDCKALTNYTRVLLKQVGIKSYYTIVYGDDEIIDFEDDFVSMQGNHAILGVDHGKEILWLECTSQIQPFAFQGDFTDNRKVLIIDSEKAEIVKTKEYTGEENVMYTKSDISMDAFGKINAQITIDSKGMVYNDRFDMKFLTQEELKKYYMKQFSGLNRLKIEEMGLNDNKENIHLVENIKLVGEVQAALSKIDFLTVNPINQLSYLPSKYKFRKNPFELQRSRKYVDELIYNVPEGFSIESVPDANRFETEFGTYAVTYVKKSATSFQMKREVVFHSGYFEKEKYEEYRKFRENILKNETSKVTITKTN